MISAVVDNIHGDTARVMIGEDAVAVYIHVRQLPPGTREGTVLRLGFTIDHAATKANLAKR